MNRDVTVVIPTIPPRQHYLIRAIESVMRQTEPATAISVAIDNKHSGAWETRNQGLRAVTTTWTAFLDDDDELCPSHIQFLLDRIEEHNLDMAWGWFDVVGGTDPFPTHRGLQYDHEHPHIVPITYIARTELLHAGIKACGGFLPDTTGSWSVQDMPLINAMCVEGAKLMAFPDTTWLWHHHGQNTSGLPTRW
jgi:hypothetical protein